MNVFAIVVTYNGRQVPYWYDNCLSSLLGSDLPVQVLVVDNASSDDSVPYIKAHFPNVILFPQEKNLGFGQANNIAINYALQHDADYVFLLNQDAWVEKDTLSQLIRISQAHEEYGILAPLNLTKEKTHIENFMANLCVDRKNVDAIGLIDDMYFQRLADVYPMKVINASSWLLPRHTLEKVGGFDPVFFHYGEDYQYAQRMAYHHLLLGLCPKVGIVHDEVKRTPEKQRMLQSNMERYTYDQVCDINIDNAYANRVKLETKKLLKSLILCRFSRVKEAFQVLGFLRRKKAAIMYSREMNKQVGRTWLQSK